jgi:Flp pilus assembly protein TadG
MMILDFLKCERGATAAEFALVLPVFLITVFSTIYLAFALGALSSMHAATEQAARCLSVNKAGLCTSANINNFATTLYHGPSLTGLTFTPSTPSCGNQVTGSGNFSLFTGISQISVTLSSSACYPAI